MATRIEVYLSDAQQKKANKGLVFQSSAAQLKQEPNAVAKVSPKVAKRLEKNMRDGKGFRFSPMDIEVLETATVEGGKIRWGKVGKALGKASKSVANDVKRDVVKSVKQDTGLDITSQKQVRGKVIGKAKSTGKDAVGVAIPGVAGFVGGVVGTELGGPAGGIVGAKIATDLSKPLTKKAQNAIDGAGATKKQRFVKGSQEARDFMASLRNKRKGITGGAAAADPGHAILPDDRQWRKIRGAPETKAFMKLVKTGQGVMEENVSGGAVSVPLGQGEFTRLNLIQPAVVNNAGRKGASIKGGSFLPY